MPRGAPAAQKLNHQPPPSSVTVHCIFSILFTGQIQLLKLLDEQFIRGIHVQRTYSQRQVILTYVHTHTHMQAEPIHTRVRADIGYVPFQHTHKY